MITTTYVVFSLGTLLLLAAAIVALSYLRSANNLSLTLAARLTLTGGICLAVTLLLRYITWGNIPLTTAFDSLCLFALLSAATAYFVSRGDRNIMLTIYLPPLAALSLATAYTAIDGIREEPSALSGMLLLTHVGLVFLSFSLFFIATLTSLAYLDQVRRLKTRKTAGLFQKLPSLENLDKTLYHLIQLGYPVFAVALVLGLFWAWYDSGKLSSTWWLSPKIFLSIFMCAIYALSYHARKAGWLRGPKLAYLVFFGVGALLGVSVILRILDWTDYNFFGVTS
jgi:ABC-type uncharacterized transport system permease subunit